MLAIRRILHPTDFSGLSRPAFELACSLARDFGAELTVLHVSPRMVTGVVEGVAVELPTGAHEETLARLEMIRPADPGLRIVRRLEEGDEAGTILRVAEEAKADLIVLGTHGRGGLSRLLAGSVAESVMRKAACPVVTIKAPHPVAELEHSSFENLTPA